jgi:hypothetical protein
LFRPFVHIRIGEVYYEFSARDCSAAKRGEISIETSGKKTSPASRKKSFPRRHPFLFLLTILALAVAGLGAFALFGGDRFTAAVSWGARNSLSRLQHLHVSFERLSGNFFEGFALEGLAAGDRKDGSIVTAKSLFLALDARESWKEKRLIFSAAADGVRIKESRLERLASAAEKDFPPQASKGSQETSTPLFSLLAPQKISAGDWAGEQGWRLKNFTMERLEPEKLDYRLSLDGSYQKEPLRLEGTAAFTEYALPKELKLNVKALKSDVSLVASVQGKSIQLNSIEGTLLSSPLKGSASFDASQADPALAADLTLNGVDLAQLRPLVPGLGDCSLEKLSAQLSGTLSKPQGKVILKNGKVSWQNYAATEINSQIDLKGTKGQLDFTALAMDVPVSASGTFGVAPGSALNIKAHAGPVVLKQLKSFIPELASADPDGTVTVDAAITGTSASPKIALSLTSPKISLMKDYDIVDVSAAATVSPDGLHIEKLSLGAFGGQFSADGTVSLKGRSPSLNLEGQATGIDLSRVAPGQIKGTLRSRFNLQGTAAKPHIDFFANIDRLDAAQFGAKDLRLSAQGDSKLNVRLEGLTTAGTPFGGGGTVVLPVGKKTSALDLEFDLKSMKLAEIFPHSVKFDGDVSMSLFIRGSFDAPSVSAELGSPQIELNGTKIIQPQATAVLKGQKADISASVLLGDRRAEVKGTADFSKTIKGSFTLGAEGFPLDALDPSLKGLVEGRATLKSKANISGTALTLNGSLTAPTVSVSSIPVTQIHIPFQFKQNRLSIPDGTLLLGGGTVRLKAEGDLGKNLYTYSVDGKAIDLKKLTAPLALPADVEGTAEIQYSGKSRLGALALHQGRGSIRLKEVAVNDYPGQLAVTGKNPFRINTGLVSFTVDDDEVYIMPGSTLTAWPDDANYRFLAFSGTAWKMPRQRPRLDPSMIPHDLLRNDSDMYHLLINGNVNVRVLNSLLGGLGAVLEAGASGTLSSEGLASNILQKMIGSGISTQFRVFDLDVAGRDYGECRVNKLKFEGEGSYADVGTTSWTEDTSTKADQQRYSLSYPLLLGPDPAKSRKKRASPKNGPSQKNDAPTNGK